MMQQAETGIVASLDDLIGLRASAQAGLLQRAISGVASAGHHAAPRKSRGMEFAEARPYQNGDDARMLDWRQTARRGRLYTKLFQEEHERPLHLLVDLGASMRFGTRCAFKSVVAARAAALLAWSAAAAGDRVGGLVWNGDKIETIRPQSRQHGVLALLGSLAIVISDFGTLDAGTERDIGALAGSAELVLLHIYDDFEAIVPPPGRYRLSDGTRSQVLDLRPAAARDAYGAAFAARRSKLERLARRSGATLLTLATHEAPQMAQVLLRQSVRRRPTSGLAA